MQNAIYPAMTLKNNFFFNFVTISVSLDYPINFTMSSRFYWNTTTELNRNRVLLRNKHRSDSVEQIFFFFFTRSAYPRSALNQMILRIQFEDVLGLRQHVFWQLFQYSWETVQCPIIERFLFSSINSWYLVSGKLSYSSASITSARQESKSGKRKRGVSINYNYSALYYSSKKKGKR